MLKRRQMFELLPNFSISTLQNLFLSNTCINVDEVRCQKMVFKWEKCRLSKLIYSRIYIKVTFLIFIFFHDISFFIFYWHWFICKKKKSDNNEKLKKKPQYFRLWTWPLPIYERVIFLAVCIVNNTEKQYM